MKKKSKIVLFSIGASILVAAIAFFVFGGPAEQDALPRHIVYVYKTTLKEIEFWRSVDDGIEKGVREYNLQYSIIGPKEETDTQGNIEALQKAIDMRPDAIVLSASDYEQLEPFAREAAENGILLLTMDSDVQGDAARCFIGTDNYQVGRLMAKELLNRIPKGGKIGVIGHTAQSKTGIDRVRGISDELEETGAGILLEPVFCDNKLYRAKELANDILDNHPDVAGFIATNEVSALGLCEAIRDAGHKDTISVVTCDHSFRQIEFLEQGLIDAMIVQKPFNMGYFSAQITDALLRDPQNTSIPDFYDTGCEIITLDNYFTQENQKLLFPFWE